MIVVTLLKWVRESNSLVQLTIDARKSCYGFNSRRISSPGPARARGAALSIPSSTTTALLIRIGVRHGEVEYEEVI